MGLGGGGGGGGDVVPSVGEFDLERECHTATEKRVKVGAVVGFLMSCFRPGGLRGRSVQGSALAAEYAQV